jgi:hypothetical protein
MSSNSVMLMSSNSAVLLTISLICSFEGEPFVCWKYFCSIPRFLVVKGSNLPSVFDFLSFFLSLVNQMETCRIESFVWVANNLLVSGDAYGLSWCVSNQSLRTKILWREKRILFNSLQDHIKTNKKRFYIPKIPLFAFKYTFCSLIFIILNMFIINRMQHLRLKKNTQLMLKLDKLTK